MQRPNTRVVVLESLSKRQREAVICVLDGLDDYNASVRMGITKDTYRTHLERAAKSLGLRGAKKRWILAIVYHGPSGLPPDADYVDGNHV